MRLPEGGERDVVGRRDARVMVAVRSGCGRFAGSHHRSHGRRVCMCGVVTGGGCQSVAAASVLRLRNAVRSSAAHGHVSEGPASRAGRRKRAGQRRAAVGSGFAWVRRWRARRRGRDLGPYEQVVREHHDLQPHLVERELLERKPHGGSGSDGLTSTRSWRQEPPSTGATQAGRTRRRIANRGYGENSAWPLPSQSLPSLTTTAPS